MKYPFSAQEFASLYSKVPRLCVDLVIKKNDEILFSQRKLSSWNGQWHLPGGTVYYKETLANAAKRIAKKELGIEITIEKMLGYIEYPSEEKERGFGWAVSIVFLCHIISGIPTENDEGKPAFFFSLPQPLIAEQKQFFVQQKMCTG